MKVRDLIDLFVAYEDYEIAICRDFDIYSVVIEDILNEEKIIVLSKGILIPRIENAG